MGRVEVYHSGIWVCDDNWDKNDADVACWSLGYSHAVKATTKASFGRGTGQIMLDGVHCDGNETSLAKCDHNGWFINDCSHAEDAGVVCFTNTTGTHAQYSFIVVLPTLSVYWFVFLFKPF